VVLVLRNLFRNLVKKSEYDDPFELISLEDQSTFLDTFSLDLSVLLGQ
jgi:hypothetical protein